MSRGTRSGANIERAWRRPWVALWLMLAAAGGSGRCVVTAEDYDGYGYGPPPPPMRAGGERAGGGGLMGPLLAAATCFTASKLIFSRGRKQNARRVHEKHQAYIKGRKVEDFADIKHQFMDAEKSLSLALDEKVRQVRALEQFLYSLPDINNDGLITRFEFDKYMNQYKREHPELTDLDLPRFEDMDHNNNGHINFNEWEEYQMMAMSALG